MELIYILVLLDEDLFFISLSWCYYLHNFCTNTFLCCVFIICQSVMLLNEISPFIAKPMDKSQAVCISNGAFSWDSPPPSQTKVKSGKKLSKKNEE